MTATDRWQLERCAICERDIDAGAVLFPLIGPVCFDCDDLRSDDALKDHPHDQ